MSDLTHLRSYPRRIVLHLHAHRLSNDSENIVVTDFHQHLFKFVHVVMVIDPEPLTIQYFICYLGHSCQSQK